MILKIFARLMLYGVVMNFYAFILILFFSASSFGAPTLITKGSSKINIGGVYSVSGAEESYSLGLSYKKFMSDNLALGGLVTVLGETGNVLAGFEVGLGGDYYIHKSDVGGLFLAVDASYSKRSTKIQNSQKITIDILSATASLGYDYFLNERVALTPSLFVRHIFDETENTFFRVVTPDGGLKVTLTAFF